jgi:hypothetical protein
LYKNLYNFLYMGKHGSVAGREVMLRMPTVLGVAEARNGITRIMDAIARGETFLIKGPKRKEALMVDAELVRRLQDAYVELIGELETLRILQDEDAMVALRAVAADEAKGRYSLPEVAGLIDEEDEVEEDGQCESGGIQ